MWADGVREAGRRETGWPEGFIPDIQEKRNNFGPKIDWGWVLLADCRVDDWVPMRADQGQCKAYSDDKPKDWTCRGGFLLTQIAELTGQRATEGRGSQGRGRVRGAFLCSMHKRSKRTKSGSLNQLLSAVGVEEKCPKRGGSAVSTMTFHAIISLPMTQAG